MGKTSLRRWQSFFNSSTIDLTLRNRAGQNEASCQSGAADSPGKTLVTQSLTSETALRMTGEHRQKICSKSKRQ
jgi:hypothetical protein